MICSISGRLGKVQDSCAYLREFYLFFLAVNSILRKISGGPLQFGYPTSNHSACGGQPVAEVPRRGVAIDRAAVREAVQLRGGLNHSGLSSIHLLVLWKTLFLTIFRWATFLCTAWTHHC